MAGTKTTTVLERDKIVPFLKKYNQGEQKLNVIFYGPPGTGKSSMARSLRLRGQADYTVTFTSEQSAAVMTGFYIPQGDHFEYLDGIGVRAWLGEPVEVYIDPKRKDLGYETVHMGGLLIIDEIDKASPDMMDVLYEVANDRRVARLFLPDGRTVKPLENFSIIGTMNGLPEDLPEAVLDRFPITIPVWMPGEGQLNVLSPAVKQLCQNLYKSVQGTGMSPKFTYRTLRAFDNLITNGSPSNLAATVVTRSSEEASALLESYTLLDDQLIKASMSTAASSNGKLPDGVVNALTSDILDFAEPATSNGHAPVQEDPLEELNLGPAGLSKRGRRI